MWPGLSLIVFVAVIFGTRVDGGRRHGGPSEDFHSFHEVKVRLKDLKNGRTEVDTSSLGNGHHLDAVGLVIMEAAKEAKNVSSSSSTSTTSNRVLFELDLHLNRDLLPQHYFQKYHKKVRRCFWLQSLQ